MAERVAPALALVIVGALPAVSGSGSGRVLFGKVLGLIWMSGLVLRLRDGRIGGHGFGYPSAFLIGTISALLGLLPLDRTRSRR
ncbi:MAG: hypothetical protein KIT25_11090 [Enhydrobacter sp.]|nr:MAG: hypothetical protein KIT25_11090 [Enhydrobacter sp.]